jgi:hypothetical protein
LTLLGKPCGLCGDAVFCGWLGEEIGLGGDGGGMRLDGLALTLDLTALFVVGGTDGSDATVEFSGAVFEGEVALEMERIEKFYFFRG